MTDEVENENQDNANNAFDNNTTTTNSTANLSQDLSSLQPTIDFNEIILKEVREMGRIP